MTAAAMLTLLLLPAVFGREEVGEVCVGEVCLKESAEDELSLLTRKLREQGASLLAADAATPGPCATNGSNKSGSGDDLRVGYRGRYEGPSPLPPEPAYSDQAVGNWSQGIGDLSGVTEWSGNPIIRAPENDPLNWIVGDPTVLHIGDEIHMWTNGAICCIQHYVAKASTPTKFVQLADAITSPGTVRAYAYLSDDNETVTLFFEQYNFPFTGSFCKTNVQAAQAKVGVWKFERYTNWAGLGIAVLSPSLPWMDEGQSCPERVGNPFVFYNKAVSKYWQYFSASSVHLSDSNIDEPRYLGLAESDKLLGPYEPLLKHPLNIKGGIPGLEVIGNGSLKIIRDPSASLEGGKAVALANRLTKNATSGATGSTIIMIRTEDGGLSWETVHAPFIGPSLVPGTWKYAYAYGYDTLPDPLDNNYILVYYNARNGYKDGHEQVGVARFPKSMIIQAKQR
mmetsp:Transcript_54015/g.96739  ORF Transcript_54015/g.96739 Transcript_54015/m.96739 type:complete len:453 (-) Transcript_54015:143-1501(-)